MILKHGPVDVLVLAAGEPRFDGTVLAELQRLAQSGTIRVLDAMILIKDDAGVRGAIDIEDLPPEQREALGFIETGTRGLFDAEDADTFFEGMVAGSAIVALAIEHYWAVTLVNAVNASGLELALEFRVPAYVIDEAFSSLSGNK